jgi:serine/threonine-protein kinase
VSTHSAASDRSFRERLHRSLGDAYVIIRELGGGGSARVFLATEIALERTVVLKVLPAELTAGIDGTRFHREILIAARLQHPHLVPLLNAGEPAADEPHGAGSALRWYAMPFVEGQTLREHLQLRGTLPLHEALRLLRELASALAYAYAKGVVHRDIKPENILLSDGVAMIADFGVAKALEDASAEAVSSGRRLTTVGMILGTPAYMAPEQVNNAHVVDHKADLYALACVAYEILTGAPPFVRPSLRATMAAQVSTAPTPLTQLRTDVPAPLADMLMRCLEKDPRQRPHSATAVVKVLDGLSAPPVPPPVPPPPAATVENTRQTRTPLPVWLVAMVVVLLVAAGWWARG